MGYYCSCTDVKFFMKAEDIEEALRLLALTHSDDFESPKELMSAVLNENGYRAFFDVSGNICSLSFENEKWHDDTSFFDVFAKCVKKGSYIEMQGEDGEMWRMIFDGEHCFEENATISWPEYDEVIAASKTKIKYGDMIKFLNDNGILLMQPLIADCVDCLLPIGWNGSAEEYEKICEKCFDAYLDIGDADLDVWDVVKETMEGMDLEKPALDEVISSCEELSKSTDKANLDKDEITR